MQNLGGDLPCRSCGQLNPAGASFCNSCGQRLDPVCPNCGRPNPAGSAFCNACGTPLTAPATTTPAPAVRAPRHLAERILRDRAGLEGERRTVTVLFVDAAGSTAAGGRVDPEVLHAVVRECTRLMVDAVHEYEGTVTQFRGDGIMAIFGAPIAHEDSARRAVAAAIFMRDSLAAYAQELRASGRPSFRYRFGLNSGPVIVGRIGDDLSMDYTAIGDTVNLASRMEQWAPPDRIYVTQSTHRQAAGYFEWLPLGSLEVRGKPEVVEAYEVLRPIAVRDRLDISGTRGLSPFVGRAQELAGLRGYFDQAKRGLGQVVFVSGDAGMGKSRLIHEFHLSLADEPLTWLEGHCSVYGMNIPYFSLMDLVKAAAGVEDGDPEERVAAKISAAVSDWEGAALAEPYLRLLLNVDPGDKQIAEMEPMARRARLVDSLRTLVHEKSRGRPLVLQIEDLHWIDEQSQEALAVLIDSIASAPVLMLLTFRPGYTPPFPVRSYVSRLALRSLGPEDTAQISEAVLQGLALPAEVRDLVFDKAEGNPFYVEEVTRSLLESGAVRRRNGALVLARSLSQVEIPDTIQGVILSRIDRLDPDAREAIQLASVIGREFSVRILQCISELQTQLERLLADLKALELVYEKAYFPEISYMFKHALTQEVAYSTLLHERRRQLHRTVADAIEELYADRLGEHYETLAHHFYEGQAWDKALDYLVLAGRKALSAYANQDAITHFDRALEAFDAGADGVGGRRHLRSELRALRGRALTQAGRWGDARTELEAALAALPADHERRLDVLRDLSLACWWSRDTPGVRRYANELMAVAKSLARVDLVTVATAWLESTKAADGDVRSSLAGLGRIFDDAEETALSLPPGPGSFYILWCYWTGELEESLARGRAILDKARRENHVPMLMEALPHLGLSLAASGRYAEAIDIFNEARQVGARYGVQSGLARSIAMEAGFHLDIFDFEGAEALQQEARELAGSLNFPPALVSAGLDLLTNFARRGEPGRARPLEDEIAEAVETEAPWHGWLWRLRFAEVRAELALARGDSEGAVKWAGEALERASAAGRVKYQVAALSCRGKALAALGLRSEALADLRRALDLARPIGDPSMFVRAASALLALEEDEALGLEAAQRAQAIATALPDDAIRKRFLAAERIATVTR